MTTLRFLDPTLKGWERAWAVLEARYGNRLCQDATTGEVWQYMGSTDSEHQFRHRALVRGMDPVGYRTYANVPILPGDFDPEAGVKGDFHSDRTHIYILETAADTIARLREHAAKSGACIEPACQECLLAAAFLGYVEGMIWLWRWSERKVLPGVGVTFSPTMPARMTRRRP